MPIDFNISDLLDFLIEDVGTSPLDTPLPDPLRQDYNNPGGSESSDEKVSDEPLPESPIFGDSDDKDQVDFDNREDKTDDSPSIKEEDRENGIGEDKVDGDTELDAEEKDEHVDEQRAKAHEDVSREDDFEEESDFDDEQDFDAELDFDNESDVEEETDSDLSTDLPTDIKIGSISESKESDESDETDKTDDTLNEPNDSESISEPMSHNSVLDNVESESIEISSEIFEADFTSSFDVDFKM